MDALTGKSEAELAEEEKADSMIKKPVDTAAQRVLIFGDSMSEYLGLRLAGYANKNGHKLTCITWVSSGPRNWAATDTLQHYIQRIKPTHVFVCLGSIPFALLTFVVLVDLALLCYFKYTNFIIGDVVNEMFSTNFSLQSIALPVGISFYTFHARPASTLCIIGVMLSYLFTERQYHRLQVRFILLPWVAKLLLFIICLQMVVEVSQESVQPFIYYQF